jgi:peptidoglycan biosynthesis protein MviN/MurJ (putative lipid II flippase)
LGIYALAWGMLAGTVAEVMLLVASLRQVDLK